MNIQDIAAIKAVEEGVAICDRTHWGRIQITGDDRLRFLHNQSTNDFESLKSGQGCDTVFVTSTARTIDLATAYVSDDAVILLVSPNRREYLMQWLDKYIFFADKVELADVTEATCTFNLIGSKSDEIIQKLTAGELIGQPLHSHNVYNVASVNGVSIAVGSSLASPGYTLICPVSDKEILWNQLLEMGAVEMGQTAWEALRITQGRPLPERELTDDYNPLEVGLWQTISFNKGCYIGQETIARLNTYKGIKTYLWGIKLNSLVEAGSTINLGEEKVGILTSITETTDGYFGLGYIRSKVGGIGLKVTIADSQGEVVEIPFVSHQYPD
ncbi:CAF17-like 4Fe-4S cluster assembly/insertion protein YgfZ [Brunnivagina elsteri]|uniref:Folate-binding protein YgfZ n=1 Tax=Brunnivagina elsteri CCALA 953 TaxID=987040 RepID=A0A2A2TKL0_9CYAN|nr:folate-binding protein YgfZ [Calothrix elsteri]PAX56538.1 folate-binding protein YgfZ [Calothrix elsteri CCALA 953]